jgi:Fe-S-cluster containining protein
MNRSADPKTVKPVAECVRCGACCEKGGPCFHREDRRLIEKGVIPTRYLCTIRKGELANDNVRGGLMRVESDIIKIKGKNNSWVCMFFDGEKKSCTIYNDRPLECRALKCWDTRVIEQIYARNRLTRKDLISAIEGLWDLVEDHQARCDYEKIQKLIEGLAGSSRKNTRRELLEIIHYDAEIRELVISKGGLEPGMLEFLFGRPLTKTLVNCGVKIQKTGKKIILDTK